ncbi:PTH2-domain-containing protein [Lentinula raphanica]|uniref:peptidyl-tRNA hydrolase n=1 Tax=Lentinula raphanica TaxID=153919 RepID=A0AA38PBM4_9AGAR|nr:PTH2-domain-containing protein [Lentinula raphanica]
MMSSQQILCTSIIAAAAFSIGYYTGRITKPTSGKDKFASRKATSVTPSKNDSGIESDSDTSEESDNGVSGLKVGPLDECKMVLVVRTDLKMSAGKIAAQCSHATLACYKTLSASNPALLRQWERNGQAKIALKCSSEEELLTLQAQAQSLNLCARSIQDAGRTQVAPGSRTVLGIIGPVKMVNTVTGALRLL